jgi:ribose-phosphate pyrophosphokinase
MEHLSAVPLLADAVHVHRMDPSVVVAPDLGAVKLAHRYASHLDLPTAYVHKVRVGGKDVKALEVIGQVEDRCPIVVDDMISTGGTVVSAVERLLETGCRPEVTLVATHGLLVGDALQRLEALPVRQLILTDSIVRDTSPALPIRTVPLGALLADAIGRLHAANP